MESGTSEICNRIQLENVLVLYLSMALFYSMPVAIPNYFTQKIFNLSFSLRSSILQMIVLDERSSNLLSHTPKKPNIAHIPAHPMKSQSHVDRWCSAEVPANGATASHHSLLRQISAKCTFAATSSV